MAENSMLDKYSLSCIAQHSRTRVHINGTNSGGTIPGLTRPVVWTLVCLGSQMGSQMEMAVRIVLHCLGSWSRQARAHRAAVRIIIPVDV